MLGACRHAVLVAGVRGIARTVTRSLVRGGASSETGRQYSRSFSLTFRTCARPDSKRAPTNPCTRERRSNMLHQGGSWCVPIGFARRTSRGRQWEGPPPAADLRARCHCSDRIGFAYEAFLSYDRRTRDVFPSAWAPRGLLLCVCLFPWEVYLLSVRARHRAHREATSQGVGYWDRCRSRGISLITLHSAAPLYVTPRSVQ